MTDSSPEREGHRDLKDSGQQEGYVVLSEAERVKGYVRPVRTVYVHVGPPGPRYPLRDLTAGDLKLFKPGTDHVGLEVYPESEAPVTGKYWTQGELDAVGRGCQQPTDMAMPIAETYARDPGFYGETFCTTCRDHLPVAEFVWQDGGERVGS